MERTARSRVSRHGITVVLRPRLRPATVPHGAHSASVHAPPWRLAQDREHRLEHTPQRSDPRVSKAQNSSDESQEEEKKYRLSTMTLQYLSDLYLSWAEPQPDDPCFETKCALIAGIAVVALACVWCSSKGKGPVLREPAGALRPKYKFTRSGRTYGKYD